jgi:hypothetical protein
MPDGRRDPLHPKRRRDLRVLSITVDGARGLALLRGQGCRELADELQLDPQWSESGRGWVVDVVHAADLLALGEWRHYIVSWRERAA